MRIAIIGSGISGLGAAWLLAPRHEVTLYERNSYLGGHTNTVDVDYDGAKLSVDTGFIVYNERNYPNLTAWFAELGVPTRASDMTFAVSLDGGRLEYGGTAGQLFAQPGNLLRPRFHRMLADLVRFYRSAPAVLRTADGSTLGGYLDRNGYSDAFVNDHLLPMAAAIWSCSPTTMLEFPVHSFVQFCDNHGLLNFIDRPQWRTVQGGGREYVRRAAARLSGRVDLSSPVQSVRRADGGVFVRAADGQERVFDQVILACHGDEALSLLADPDADERRVLGGFRYQRNHVVLHRDPALMPRRRRVWSSWNYLGEGGDRQRRVAATYWMNRLQGIEDRHPLFVSLNPLHDPEPATVFGEFSYDHPVFDQTARLCRQQLGAIQGARRTWFCGAHLGYGFHEDGFRSGISVARALGAQVPWPSDVPAARPDIDRPFTMSG